MAESYVPLPYAGRRYTPDTSRLQSIYGRSGEALARLSLQRGATTADTLARLGSILSATSGGYREDAAQRAALALRETEQKAAREFAAEQKRLERDERAAERTTDREVRSAERGDLRFERDLEREIENERRTALDAFVSKYGGIVGPNGGYTYEHADTAVRVPAPAGRVTPHSEAFQAVIWHLLVSHPLLQRNSTKW